MKELYVVPNESGQRFDKYLKKYMPLAQNSFFYKMLRKKNITLNDKKADGSEKLIEGDIIKLFFSKETIEKFRASTSTDEYTKAYTIFQDKIKVLYEDEYILLLNKPAGILSQKADESDRSLNEWLIGYLLETKSLTKIELETFKPSICNRLDRNTSGIVLCGKSLIGLQCLNDILKNRTIQKYYYCVVEGIIEQERLIDGYLKKDERNNKVSITKKQFTKEDSYIKTAYRPLQKGNQKTLLEVELITGKTHQIRAHLASIGHPILGDYKYGKKSANDFYKKSYSIQSQLLHAHCVIFPKLETPLDALSKKKFTAQLPAIFAKVMED